MKPIKIVSCTKLSVEDSKNTPLYKSIEDIDSSTINLEFVYNNTESLSKVYNKHLNQSDNYDFVVFCHDDVYIDDAKLQQKLYNAYNNLGYNIIGIAGGINPEIKFPSLWHLMCTKQHWRGQVATPISDKTIITTVFGPTPSRVVIADGCFLAVHVPSVLKANWKFNENYDFHHYDISSCIDANQLKLKIGVYPIYVIHSSPGLTSLDDVAWRASNDKFLQEYGQNS